MLDVHSQREEVQEDEPRTRAGPLGKGTCGASRRLRSAVGRNGGACSARLHSMSLASKEMHNSFVAT